MTASRFRRFCLVAAIGSIVGASSFCGAVSEAQAALILGWDFNGGAGTETSVNATTQNLSGAAVAVTRGSGVSGSALANSFNSTSYTVGGTIGNAAANGDFLQFSFVVPTNTTVSLSDLDANFRRSSTGPDAFLWQYDVGGGFVDIGSSFLFTDTNTNGVNQTDVLLSGISALQNIAAGTNVSLRVLGAGATNSGGTFALGRLTGDDLVLNGTVSAIPEPTSLVLCTAAALSYGGAAWRKRRRRQIA
jgi:hypothetical protein